MNMATRFDGEAIPTSVLAIGVTKEARVMM